MSKPLTALLFLSLLFLSTPSFAQVATEQDATATSPTIIQKILDDIRKLQIALDELKQELESLSELVMQTIDDFHLFQDQTNQNITQLQQTDAALQQTDQNLQNQINGIQSTPFTIDRTKIYEVANVNPNENTAFCNDNNDILLFAYCTGSLIGTLPNIPSLLFDNFDDLDYTNNPAWTVINGSWSINTLGPYSGRLAMSSVGIDNLLSTPVVINSIPLSMEMRILSNAPFSQHRIEISDVSTSLSNGYFIRLYSNGPLSYVDFYRRDNGIGALLMIGNNFDISPGNLYTIKATRSTAGFWQLYFNNSPVGPAVFDTTYTTFSSTFLAAYDISQTGVEFDDVTVSVMDINQGSSSAIQNINDYTSPMGIRCLQNGSAHVLCLRQP